MRAIVLTTTILGLSVFASNLDAAAITFTAEGTFEAVDPTKDTLGLHGEKYKFTVEFEDTAVYETFRSFPTVFEITNTNRLDILGGISAGSYEASFGVTFRPGQSGQLFTGSVNPDTEAGNKLDWNIQNGPILLLESSFTSEVPGITSGERISTTHFGGPMMPRFVNTSNQDAYNVSGFTAGPGLGMPPVVPEPSTLPMIAMAIGGCAIQRRKRRA